MAKGKQRLGSLLLTAALLLGLSGQAEAADTVEHTVEDTARYLCQTIPSPQVGAIGGEWLVLGLARSGCTVPEGYFQNYCAAVEEYVEARKGVLHEKKYTEYSRLILALSALGRDARNVAGYDLTKPLGDFEKTVWQGINGPIWALMALDSRDYPMPQNPEAAVQATRQKYVEEILSRQLESGGWNLTDKGGSAAADPDVTGMALQALSKYRDREDVNAAVKKGLTCLSQLQDTSGGFANAESVAQALVALCELGISLEDPRFVKNGNTLLDSLMTFYLPGKGFRHTANDSASNPMATEQAFYALVAVRRIAQGENSLYHMETAPFSPGNAVTMVRLSAMVVPALCLSPRADIWCQGIAVLLWLMPDGIEGL